MKGLGLAVATPTPSACGLNPLGRRPHAQLNTRDCAKPKLGRGVSRNGTLELEPEPAAAAGSRGATAMQRAIAAARQQGGLQKVDPNALQVKRTASASELKAALAKKPRKSPPEQAAGGVSPDPSWALERLLAHAVRGIMTDTPTDTPGTLPLPLLMRMSNPNPQLLRPCGVRHRAWRGWWGSQWT